MSGESGGYVLQLTESELVSLYIVLTRHEGELDERQQELLERVAGLIYGLLSVEQIEQIESYYSSL